MKLFDDKKHAFVVRSTEEFCRNYSFFHNSYIMKYAGIPLDCLNCKKDLLHHKSYHISYHDACKFCVQNWYKISANNVKEFHEMESKEMHYLRSVCPYCDKRFCWPYFAKKHIKFEHKLAPFNCEQCTKTFHSKQAKEYHYNVQHSTSKFTEVCNVCGKELASRGGGGPNFSSSLYFFYPELNKLAYWISAL